MMRAIATIIDRIINVTEISKDTSNNRISMIPTTEAIEESTVYVANVSFKLNPKYSLTIQNPGSLTCEAKAVPHPVASVTKAKFTLGELPSIGITNPAVDIAATVPDPKQIRNIAATIHASKIGDIEDPSNILAIYSPTPPSIITCLKAPPPL